MASRPAGAERPGRKLNLGCGTDIRPAGEGWVNLDLAPLKGVDMVHDLTRLPWPFKDGEFVHVLCSHVLEHVPERLPGRDGDGLLLVLEEVHRVLAPRGTLEAALPVWHDERYWTDPTHRRVIPVEMWRYLEPGTEKPWYSRARFRVQRVAWEQPGARHDRWLPLGPRRMGLLAHLWARAPFLRPLIPRKHGQVRVRLERLPAAGAPP